MFHAYHNDPFTSQVLFTSLLFSFLHFSSTSFHFLPLPSLSFPFIPFPSPPAGFLISLIEDPRGWEGKGKEREGKGSEGK